MSNKMENTQRSNLLLSFAVFKRLYDEKKDIYEIIALFIRRELSNPGLNEFSLLEITKKINKEYNFDIPQAIVKISLNKIKREGGLKLELSKYTKLEKFENVDIIDCDSGLAIKEEEYIVGMLKDSIGKTTLLDDDIRKSLESYILNKNDVNNISSYIDSCVIKNSSNKRFVEGLNEIKQGLILYEGISYGIENINPNRWSKKTIFLDTEILFNLGSYNGELFKKMTGDFISLLKIVNKTNRIIRLRFSGDVKKEVDSLFNVAKLIIERRRSYQPNSVIKSILEKCNSSSDIVNENVDFYVLLDKLGIKEYEEQLRYSKGMHKYNLEEDNPDWDEKTRKHMKQLSCINILRKGNEYATLEKIEYLLLTETRNTISRAIELKKVGYFPLALSLFDVTNQLWFKVNKGLGNLELPSTLDIRNKAKITLSASLAKKVSEEYDKVHEDYKGKSIDRNILIDKISDLKKIEKYPDDINELNCEEIRQLIVDSDSMEKHYKEKCFYKKESEDKSDIIQDKDNEISKLQAQNEINEIQKQNEISKLQAQNEINEIQKQNEINEIQTQKEVRRVRNKRVINGIVCLATVALLFYFSAYLIPYVGKPITYIVNGLPLILAVVSFLGIDILKIKSWYKKAMRSLKKDNKL